MSRLAKHHRGVPRTILQTSRLRLREWRRADGAALARHCNTEDVMRWLSGRPLTPAEHHELVDWLLEQQRDYGITFWVMERRQDDAFLGFCGLVKVDELDSTVLGATELGWRLRSDCWGHGYAREASVACLRHAFDQLNELRVVSRTAPDNDRGRRLLCHLGFERDPRLDYVPADNQAPLAVYAMSYHRWLAAKSVDQSTPMSIS